MAKQTDTGVYQLKNGNWAYRFTLTKDGHRTDIRKSKDEQGHPLKSKRDAIKARRAAIVLEQEKTNRRIIERKTVNEVWKEYCEKGREGKAYRTIQKQDSVAVREQKQRFIEDLDGSRISSVDLVNCLPDGTIQTVNSFKYPSREIKAKLGIQFKYHYLRHTYGTMMAEMNTPSHLLCNQMGHGNIRITQRYYLGVSPTGIEALHKNLEHL